METYQIIAGLRDIIQLHRWLIVKVVKDPKKATVILRLMIFGRIRNRHSNKKVKVKLK